MPRNPFTTNDRVFGDPFITALNSSINLLNNSVHPGGAYPRAKVLYPSLNVLRTFAHSGYAEDDRRRALSVATATFDDFEKAYLDVMTEFEKMRGRARAWWRKAQLTSQLEGGRQDLVWLRQLKENISPLHIELQEHFYTMVVKYPRGSEADNMTAAEFFDPLYKLRNEYFLRPSFEVLEAYRRVSKELQSSTYYSEVLRAGLTSTAVSVWDAHLEDHELELDVLSMVETLV